MYNNEQKLAAKMFALGIQKMEVDGAEENGSARVSITKDGKSYLIWTK